MIAEVAVLLVCIIAYFVIKDMKPRSMPPGPLEIPFIGNTPVQDVDEVESLRKKYGDIVTIRIGNARIVVISDYKTGKELLASTDTIDRPDFFRTLNLNIGIDRGLVGGNGLGWQHDRRFVLRHLRDLGMGKSYLEHAINQEAQIMVDDIKSLNGKPSLYPRCIRYCVLNVIWQMVAGERYDLESTTNDKVFELLEETLSASLLVLTESFFPVVNYLPRSIKNFLFKTEVLKHLMDELLVTLQKCVDDHKAKKSDGRPHDLISDYLEEMERDNSDDSLFTTGALLQMINDLFTAGSETVTTTLKFAIMYMAQYPEKVKICQKQIDEVVGDSMVSLSDKPNLPYVEAFTTELLRKSSLITLNPSRSLVRDVMVNGYTLPKGTHITVNNYFVHHDPSFWKDPEDFSPERFIDEEGKFSTKLGRSFVFGSGRRQCIGEALARMEVFLFTAALLQNFEVRAPEGATLLTKPRTSLMISTPPEQLLIYKIRK